MPGAFDVFRLLAPIAPDEFVERHWERCPLVLSRGDATYYDTLLRRNDVYAHLSAAEIRPPSVSLVHPREPRQVRPLADSASPAEAPDVERLRSRYLDGATIKVHALQRRNEPLAALCRSLERYFNGDTGMDVYLTPAESRSFAPHYDRYEFFVLQLDGAKWWRVYDSPVSLPRAGNDDVEPVTAGRVLHEVELQAGDLLYVPRGFVHEAYTSASASLSVSIGIQPYTVYHALVGALEALERRDVRLRRGLPPGFALSDQTDVLAAQLVDLLRTAGTQADVRAGVDGLADRMVLHAHPPPGPRLGDDEAAATLTLASTVRVRPALLWRLSARDDSVTLVRPGRRLTFPRTVEEALRFIFEARALRVEFIPDSLDDDGKLVLARRLVAEGFLEPAADGGTDG